MTDYIELARPIVAERELAKGRRLTACVVTFGCQMNARDSEKLSGVLKAVGYELISSEKADFVIFNTCTVRDNADQRVYGRLGALSGYKKKNPGMVVALCGCMMQEDSVIEKLKKSYPFVDLIFGTHNLNNFPRLLYDVLTSEGRSIIDIWKEPGDISEDLPNLRKFSFKGAVNITYGCDNFCSYCIVPYVRGRERSRSPEEILREVRALAMDGVSEVMLLGQNVNSYGKGISGASFPELLRLVEKVEGIRRIRFMTSHPKDLCDELIEVIAGSEKICRHLHLPLQSGSNEILRRMNRRYTREGYLDLVHRIRERIPDLAITSDIIIGFPGETPEDVDLTIDVVKRAQLDNAFTFIYSKRAGTPAASMEDQVDPAVAKDGFDRLLKVVQDTARDRALLVKGEVMEVLVESVNEQDEGYLTGRLSNNLLVHFPGEKALVGTYQRVHLAECKGFYYLGEISNNDYTE